MSETDSNRTPIVWLRVAVRVVLGLAILGIGVGVFSFLVATKPKVPRSDEARLAFQVRSITAELVEAPRVWRGFGTARAKSSADVEAEVAGLVVERPETLDPGVWVDAGTLLVQLDDTEYLAVLSRTEEVIAALEADLRGLDVEAESLEDSIALAEESVRLRESQLERFRSAIGAGGANRFEVEALEQRLTEDRRTLEALEQRRDLIPTRRARLRAQLQSERSSARIARLNVERCRITSPIDGIVQEVLVDEGERVGIGEGVVRVVDLRRIEVPLKVPVSAGSRLRIGDRAELSGSGAGGETWSGSVVRIAPEADPATRTVTVFAEVEQGVEDRVGASAHLAGMLLPGQFLAGSVYGGESSQRVVVPRSAVQRDRVMVVSEESRVEPRIVEVSHFVDASYPSLHPHERQWAVLSSGVDPGERVIISNLDDLDAGTPVRAVDAAGLLAGGNGGGTS